MRVSHALLASAALVLSACAGTTTTAYNAKPANDVAQKAAAKQTIAPGDVVITEGKAVHHYHVLAVISVHGDADDVTHEDVNKALRSEAAAHGANAVINVTYKTDAKSGILTATGTAVVYTPKAKEAPAAQQSAPADKQPAKK